MDYAEREGEAIAVRGSHMTPSKSGAMCCSGCGSVTGGVRVMSASHQSEDSVSALLCQSKSVMAETALPKGAWPLSGGSVRTQDQVLSWSQGVSCAGHFPLSKPCLCHVSCIAAWAKPGGD